MISNKKITTTLLVLISGLLMWSMFFKNNPKGIDVKEIKQLQRRYIYDSIVFVKKVDSLNSVIHNTEERIQIIHINRKISNEKFKKLIDSVLSIRALDSLRKSNRNRGKQRYITTRDSSVFELL